MTNRFGVSAAMGAFLALGLVSGSAAAMPGTETASPANGHQEASVGQVALTVEAEDDGLNCTKSRKRMFVDGEGWIVRRVTTCR